MASAKIAITVEEGLLRDVDRWVREGRYANRSQAIQAALAKEQERHKKTRLREALKHVNKAEEQALAEEWLAGELPWPEY